MSDWKKGKKVYAKLPWKCGTCGLEQIDELLLNSTVTTIRLGDGHSQNSIETDVTCMRCHRIETLIIN